ncbi:MAG: AfsR/SARP family transcriptional regulator [Bacillota bacterium]
MNNLFQNIQIYTLGRFKIKKQQKGLVSDISELNKQWQLFLYLVFHQSQTISHQELCEKLDLLKNEYPEDSLRKIVYRLRKKLDYDPGKLIITKRKGYVLNSEVNIWIDCLQFEKLYQKAKSNVSNTDPYQQAFQLYHGPFLNSDSIPPWLLEKRNYYYDLFLETVEGYIETLDKNNQYQEMVDLYNVALRIYPYEVIFHLGLFNTYKKMDKDNLARNFAEESIMLLKDENLNVPEKLEQEIFQYSNNFNPQTYKEEILQNGNINNDIFQCGPITFSHIYELEKRRAEREGHNLFLVHWNLTGNVPPQKMQQGEKTFLQLLYNNLRQSDIMTRILPNYYLQLFPHITQENIKKIIGRINSNFQMQFSTMDINLDWECEELKG